MFSNPLMFDDTYQGRMSPFAKEKVFADYQRGMTIKDISLKYGILQARVKAIVY